MNAAFNAILHAKPPHPSTVQDLISLARTVFGDNGTTGSFNLYRMHNKNHTRALLTTTNYVSPVNIVTGTKTVVGEARVMPDPRRGIPPNAPNGRPGIWLVGVNIETCALVHNALVPQPIETSCSELYEVQATHVGQADQVQLRLSDLVAHQGDLGMSESSFRKMLEDLKDVASVRCMYVGPGI